MPPQDQSTVNDTCFSAFSEVPDITVFAKIGQSATKTLRTPGHESSRKRPSPSRSPSPTPRRMKTPGHGSQMNNNGTTSFLIDFTQQMEGVNTYRQHSPVDGAFLANEGAGHDFAIRGAAADGHSIRTASLAVEQASLAVEQASLAAEQENFAIKGFGTRPATSYNSYRTASNASNTTSIGSIRGAFKQVNGLRQTALSAKRESRSRRCICRARGESRDTGSF
ncbi:uncharacterized protein MYCGRDRAFT_97687 [Zymoseptoria tritici IPO323]|uniref:Uncharacterized protein n=1 Tax=Zymoseptoria tritici (strain CBS 115943 / IPO323) TaxID=336722 RepID=F9XR01_ZYMTI|nr:uncharacterized protein MYCGRDRAFT_97687 [Zymoseptoria tritici IPO323]EGP82331.1 hypothetical protein MYCGRDRAFT_97687 [Zymoseptoria tritici IPO323]